MCEIFKFHGTAARDVVPRLQELFRLEFQDFPPERETSSRLYLIAETLAFVDSEDRLGCEFLARNPGWAFTPFPNGNLKERYQVPASFCSLHFPWETYRDAIVNPGVYADLMDLLYRKTKFGESPDMEICNSLWKRYLQEIETSDLTPEDALNFADLHPFSIEFSFHESAGAVVRSSNGGPNPEMRQTMKKYFEENLRNFDHLSKSHQEFLVALAGFFINDDVEGIFLQDFLRESGDTFFEKMFGLIVLQLQKNFAQKQVKTWLRESKNDERTFERWGRIQKAIAPTPISLEIL